jgi:hypothetical protein
MPSLLAGANGVLATACAAIVLVRSVDKPSSVVGEFFDVGSGLWTAVFGLVILGAGVYVLLVVANYVDDNYNWIF